MLDPIKISYLLCLHLCIVGIEGAKILAMFPSPSKSHYILGQVLFEELGEKGHEVTIVSPFEIKYANEKIRQLKLDGMSKYLEENGQDPNFFSKHQKSVLGGITNLVYGTATIADFTLGHKKVQELLKSDETFDLLLLDSFMTDSLLGLAYYYQIPSVVLSSTGTNKFVNEMVANPNNPAYNPNIHLGFSDNMTLFERFINTMIGIFDEFNYKFTYIPSQESIYKRYFTQLANDEELPPLIDLIHNVSIVFINANPVSNYPRPYCPSMIEVGGMHIKKIQDNIGLSEDILNFIEEAEDGVIFFSLGANLKSSDLPEEIREVFVNSFKKFPKIRVIWKWENLTLPKQPYNTVIGPWMPQQEILAHPNVRLFITTGGLLGVMEAVYYGKPMIGLPVFGDQNLNIMRAQVNGYAIKLNYENVTEDVLTEAIQAMLYNQSYRDNALKAATLFRDHQIHPLDKTIYYIDYVLRTKGAAHLKTGAVNLIFYQRHLVDVTLIIVFGIFFVLLFLSAIIQFVLRKNNQRIMNEMTTKANLTVTNLDCLKPGSISRSHSNSMDRESMDRSKMKKQL